MKLLSAYLDGEVTPRELAEVEELLRSDGEARELFRRLKRTSGLLGEMERLPAPVQLQRRVLGAVSQRKSIPLLERLRSSLLSPWSPAPVIAAAFSVVLIATVVYFAYVGGPMQPPAPDGEAATEIADVRTPPTDRDEEQEKDFVFADEVDEEGLGEQPAPTAAPGAEAEGGGTAVAAEPRAEREREAASTASGRARAQEEAPAATRQPERYVVAPEREASDDLVAAEPSERMDARLQAETATLDSDTGFEAGLKRPGIFSARERTYGYYAEGADYETSNRFYVSEARTHITERGQPRQLDASAPLGDDCNPLFDPGTFDPPRLTAFDFFGRGERAGVQELQVFGEAHVARNGAILYLRLVGDSGYRNLIDAFADHLLAARLIPARREQNPVSVFYNFVVVIRATE